MKRLTDLNILRSRCSEIWVSYIAFHPGISKNVNSTRESWAARSLSNSLA